jgi:hypothetical protein
MSKGLLAGAGVIGMANHDLSVVGGTIHDMPLVPAQCWLRTFKIASGTSSATCFVINRHDRQWLITAKHFLEGSAPIGTGSMHIFTHEGKEDAQLKPEFVPPVQPGADIAVFSLGDYKMVRDELTLNASADGLVLSQDVFFLGYPLPDRVPLSGTLPFVKRGIVSARTAINDVSIWYVDGHNNPGFSGGPVVFNQGGGIGTIWHVLGVVSGYITEAIAVNGNEGKLGEVNSNSGIIVVYDIKHAVDAIDAFVGAGPKSDDGTAAAS